MSDTTIVVIGVMTFFTAALVLVVIAEQIQRRKWIRQWPPITENEYLAKCPAGVDPQKALKVRRIVSEQLGIDYDRIYPDQRFVEDF